MGPIFLAHKYNVRCPMTGCWLYEIILPQFIYLLVNNVQVSPWMPLKCLSYGTITSSIDTVFHQVGASYIKSPSTKNVVIPLQQRFDFFLFWCDVVGQLLNECLQYVRLLGSCFGASSSAASCRLMHGWIGRHCGFQHFDGVHPAKTCAVGDGPRGRRRVDGSHSQISMPITRQKRATDETCDRRTDQDWCDHSQRPLHQIVLAWFFPTASATLCELARPTAVASFLHSPTNKRRLLRQQY